MADRPTRSTEDELVVALRATRGSSGSAARPACLGQARLVRDLPR